ncbi:MAG: hypothetical protein Q8936_01620 [Bacillota bacterium]|nr:hypothetical protein [Bacillota bacterium]
MMADPQTSYAIFKLIADIDWSKVVTLCGGAVSGAVLTGVISSIREKSKLKTDLQLKVSELITDKITSIHEEIVKMYNFIENIIDYSRTYCLCEMYITLRDISSKSKIEKDLANSTLMVIDSLMKEYENIKNSGEKCSNEIKALNNIFETRIIILYKFQDRIKDINELYSKIYDTQKNTLNTARYTASNHFDKCEQFSEKDINQLVFFRIFFDDNAEKLQYLLKMLQDEVQNEFLGKIFRVKVNEVEKEPCKYMSDDAWEI